MSSTPPDSSLFRAEAVAARAPRQVGDVVLWPGASSRWLALLAWALLLSLAALLVFGQYARRSTVNGVLLPAAGLIRLAAPQAGTVIESQVREGQVVQAGQLLFVLSDDRGGPGDEAWQRQVAERIATRKASLEADLRRVELAERLESGQLARRIDTLKAEQAQAQRQLMLLRQRAQGADEATQRYQSLFRQGFVSRDELLARETQQSELQGQVQALQRDLLALERQLLEARREADTQKTRSAIQRGELDREAQQAGREYTEIEARRRVQVSAPAAGRISQLRAEVGQSVEAGRQLAQLVPGDSALVARLYVPSSAAGFVRPGMPVLLRYDAFPYQKYGQHRGEVLSVSGAAATPAELGEAAWRPEWAAEPLFAVTVKLPAQTVEGAALPLQAGMRVEADLLHESRRLYEWMLEPLLGVKERMRTE
ncbi:HlyD family efflux transporter periplasmic adaptor subunit [Ideonella sp. 4Y16]|uniref:HlyD family efflux transporter periplasmic adaptor subunit n=1 Tax=Ideonella alba TaxID=2824118 RepID=A0A940YCB8_9BURK|nr:HlyD family efflux transporter periplasmic adaptor subunit [Ideonella alba]MBQ0930042.1 HlyD family efflux transporter periplasmic adaptor subunit [Ideonella alba]MBQ0946102.1 HlyD family efflux transporter periplasmic adaptor subunit [Ideonella alba]